MATLSVEQHLEAFLDEWQATTVAVAEALKRKDTSFLTNVVILDGMDRANVVNRKGSAHLDDAAAALLRREKLSAKIAGSTARRALIKGFADRIPKALRTSQLSEHAIIAKAKATLASHPRDDGTYLFPLVFAPLAKSTDFRIGAARIIAKPVLEAELSDSWKRRDADASDLRKRLARDWKTQSVEFDHYITVDIAGYEQAMAWPAARDAAECLLNIMRMYFGYAIMDDVRIGDGFIWQNRRSTLRLTIGGEICLSTSVGGSASHLEDDWVEPFDRDMGRFGRLLASVVSSHTQDDGRPDPMFERIIYFNRLIAEAYCEPHHPIRLVRLVSALEALTLIGPLDKAHNLAHRCGAAGGHGDPHYYCQIYDSVREAYRWRNAVVHGDAPAQCRVMRAFRSLEEHLLDIYLGLLSLHAGISNAVRPRSITVLRREFDQRIDMFFWAPSLVT